MDISRLVVEDAARGSFRVHRSAMISEEICALERERIFDRCWLYVGHDSEIPNPGDFRRRTVAERPLILIRGRDGKVRVFYNTCPHRGAMVARQDKGSADTLTCFYHGWSFNSQGELIAVPEQAGYSKQFSKADHTLGIPPHVESYRGMHFVNFSADAPTLSDWLGEAKTIMDLSLDAADVLGGWEVIRGSARYDIRANWKLMAENSVDGYHLPTVHQTYLSYIAQRHRMAGAARINTNAVYKASRSFAIANGHGGITVGMPGRPIASPSPFWTEEAIAEVGRIRERLLERFGAERGAEMADNSRLMIIFPNLAFQDTHSGFRFRQWWPKGPGLMEINQWELVPREENEEIHAYRQELSLAFLGPGGFATPDDVEALESCQTGFKAREFEWSDVSRGMHRQPQQSDDEIQMRSFWRQWHAMLQGQARAAHFDDPAIPAAALAEERK